MSSAAKVGVFTVIMLIIAGYFILRIEDITLGGGDGRSVIAIFDTVAGLEPKSPVRLAGVRVGTVDEIQLTPEGNARVIMSVHEDVKIYPGASARVASLGLLGEKYVEILPGNTAAAPLPEDQAVVIPGTEVPTIDDVTSQVSAIAHDVKAITESLRAAVGGPAGQQRLIEIVENVRSVTERVDLLILQNQGNVNATLENVAAITADLRRDIPQIAASIESFADALQGTVGENRQDIRALVGNLRDLSADLQVTATNLNEITGQVRAGEGTIGKLFFSEEAHERLTGALGAVQEGVGELRKTLGRVERVGLDLGIRSEYLAGLDAREFGFEGQSRSSLFANIIPNPDINRFYFVALTDDPIGTKDEKVIVTTTLLPDGTESTTAVRETRFEQDFLLSAQVGWRIEDDINLRIGLFDNSGGIGVDYGYNDRLSFTGEIYDFGDRRDPNPHLRLFSNYVLRREREDFPVVFVTAGVDNIFNDTAFTVGGGVRWRDEDLKYLLGSVPIR